MKYYSNGVIDSSVLSDNLSQFDGPCAHAWRLANITMVDSQCVDNACAAAGCLGGGVSGSQNLPLYFAYFASVLLVRKSHVLACSAGRAGWYAQNLTILRSTFSNCSAQGQVKSRSLINFHLLTCDLLKI